MKVSPIIFLDSGIGGLPYLEAAQKYLPDESFIYIADRKNFPYGNKKAKDIKKAVFSVVDNIIRKLNPKIIVIACNTASVVALAGLREIFSIPFIGVVPAIKPAAFLTKNKTLGVIASFITVEDEYLKKLIREFAGDCNVIRVTAGEVINFVETQYFTASKDEKIKVVYNAIHLLKEERVDSVILACTHFLLLDDEFKQVMGRDVMVVDSRDGVAKQLVRVLDKNKLRYDNKLRNKNVLRYKEELSSENNEKPCKLCKPCKLRAALFITGKEPPEDRYLLFAEKYGLTFSGRI